MFEKARPLGARKVLGIQKDLKMGSGPVIISVRTRKREYFRLDGDK